MASASNSAEVVTRENEHALLGDAWSEAPSPESDGVVLHHTLSALSFVTGPLAEGDADGAIDQESSAASFEEIWQHSLRLLIDLLGAERAFLFDLDYEGETPEAAQGAPVCIASRDFDGEEIQQPQEKVPLAFLTRIPLERRPLFGSSTAEGSTGEDLAEGDSPQRAGFPIEIAGGKPLAILYVENRFRSLTLDRRALRLAQVHCATLAAAVEFRRLKIENQSLWHDVSVLREKTTASSKTSTTAPARQTGGRGNKTVDRGDLKGDYSMIVGSSPRLMEIFGIIDRIGTSSAPVLINGESGTGKELVAQAVHANSPRRGKAFVSENCGALTETLLESELFGYVRGAFTGATKDNKGLFELAIGGTLFLDEVGDMSSGMQKKLLRVLQEGVIRRVGGKEYIPVDVRILSATNKDLLEEVRAGNFREDLYYRLNVINLKLPPLRDRKDDIPPLVEHFLAGLAADSGTSKDLDPAALEVIANYDWPGNIRELQNEARRMFALSDSVIRLQDLSDTIRAGNRHDVPFQDLGRELSSLTLKEATERLEREMIRNALVQCRGNKSLVAKMLQVPKTSLYNKINKYGIDKG